MVEDKRSNEEPFKTLFTLFPPSNPSLATFDLKKKLIFASLGTFFTDNLEVYQKIINAFAEDDQDLTVVISTGDKIYDILKESKNIPSNVYLVKSAPQIDILRRASVFISHCGMNSTSESVHFGVPMVCIPLSADQPLVANRIANELKLGLFFNHATMSSLELRQGIMKIISDKSFHERALKFSEYSRKYKGEQTGADLLVDLLKRKE